MIEKLNIARVRDLRRTALTNVRYKLMMTVVRNGKEEHLRRNEIGEDTRAGFTEDSRIENDAFILRYSTYREILQDEKSRLFMGSSIGLTKVYVMV